MNSPQLSLNSQLSTSTSSDPDQITYPLLTHLPQSALHFLLYIFNLSWSTHTFSSTWKQSTIISNLKPGKPSDSPSSYRPISLTSCTSKLFERMVLGRLTYFLEQQDILSPVQAGFRPGRSAVDQVLFLSQSITDSFHQSKPGARTALPLWILRKLLTQFGTLPFSLNSSLFRSSSLLC